MRLSEKDCLFFINSNSSFCCINLFINFTPLFIDSAIFLLISPSFLSITLSSFCCTNLFINFAPFFIDFAFFFINYTLFLLLHQSFYQFRSSFYRQGTCRVWNGGFSPQYPESSRHPPATFR